MGKVGERWGRELGERGGGEEVGEVGDVLEGGGRRWGFEKLGTSTPGIM